MRTLLCRVFTSRPESVIGRRILGIPGGCSVVCEQFLWPKDDHVLHDYETIWCTTEFASVDVRRSEELSDL